MNQIRYEIAKSVLKKMLKAGLISRKEFERIDVLNKDKFFGMVG